MAKQKADAAEKLAPPLDREQRIVRVLTSQGRPRNEINLYEESELDRLEALCEPNGGLVVGTRAKFAEILEARNKRLEASKAST